MCLTISPLLAMNFVIIIFFNFLGVVIVIALGEIIDIIPGPAALGCAGPALQVHSA